MIAYRLAWIKEPASGLILKATIVWLDGYRCKSKGRDKKKIQINKLASNALR